MLVIKQRKKLGPGELVVIEQKAINKIKAKKYSVRFNTHEQYLIKENILANGVLYSVVSKTTVRGSSTTNYQQLLQNKQKLTLIENSLLTKSKLSFDMIYQGYSRDARSFILNKYSIKVL